MSSEKFADMPKGLVFKCIELKQTYCNIFRMLDVWYWTNVGQNWRNLMSHWWSQLPPVSGKAALVLWNLPISLAVYSQSQFWIRKQRRRPCMICSSWQVLRVEQRAPWLSGSCSLQSTTQKPCRELQNLVPCLPASLPLRTSEQLNPVKSPADSTAFSSSLGRLEGSIRA